MYYWEHICPYRNTVSYHKLFHFQHIWYYNDRLPGIWVCLLGKHQMFPLNETHLTFSSGNCPRIKDHIIMGFLNHKS